MEIKKICAKCGFQHNPETDGNRCPKCGFIDYGNKEIVEVTNKEGNTIKIIRLQSEGENFYEYDTSSPPFREDAWGKYYLGKCYSKTNSCFLKEVTIISSEQNLYITSMWEHLKSTSISKITQKVFIPIIDKIDDSYPECCYIVEDFFDGVSLYDIMHGQIYGVDGRPIDFAIDMYGMYQDNKLDFTKIVIKEILKGVKFMHDNDVCMTYIELPENIIFTKSGEIKIRMISSLFYSCQKQFTIIPWVYDALFPTEYISPEYYEFGRHINERSEIYTVGVFTYCIFTGHLPNKGGASLEECHCVHGPIIDPRDDDYVDKPCIGLCHDRLLLDGIEDRHLKMIIDKATRRNPDERFQSAAEFINALEGIWAVQENVLGMNETIPSSWYKRLFSFSFFDVFPFKLHRIKKIVLFILITIFICSNLGAQNHLRIHHSGGSHIDVPVAQIDSISFLDTDSLTVVEAELSGNWLWGNKEKGYYELMSFSKDHTYTAYDNYFTYGFDITTYGFYSQYSAMLTLWSNGFGYQHRYNWYITELSENAFSVMTKMGPFTYYKLQPNVIHLKVGESLACNGGESYIFADGVVAKTEDEMLVGIKPGTTFIEKLIAATNTIFAYKVIVE